MVQLDYIDSLQINVFYINEFLDMVREFQEQSVFSQIIYGKKSWNNDYSANTFEKSTVHSFTREGYYKMRDMRKNANKISTIVFMLTIFRSGFIEKTT